MRPAPVAAALCWSLVALAPPPGGGPVGSLLLVLGLLGLPTIALWVGATCSLPVTGGCCVLLVAVWSRSEGYFNPLILWIVLGGAVVGQLLRSRAEVREQLAQRARELQEEREVFVQEAVRQERSRIARELHDIVAHNVSVMVVQAAAGQRLAKADPGLAREALDEIAAAVAEAQGEMAALVDLLGTETTPTDVPLAEVLEGLVRRAQRTGLRVTYRRAGPLPPLRPAVAEVAHRVVQEALTNALKHAPGAEITVTAAPRADGIELDVTNGPAPAGALTRVGGGHGVRGMSERALAVGGRCTAGQSSDGGWRVQLVLPC